MNSTALIDRFCRAIDLEIRELKAHGRPRRLLAGKRVSAAPGRVLYSFQLNSPLRTRDDIPARVEIGETRHECQIVARADASVTISIATDLGEIIPEAMLVVDESELLIQLKKRLNGLTDDGAAPDHNLDLAERAITGKQGPVKALRPGTVPTGLRPEQINAVDTVLSHETTFLWGPPGTGKTYTLAAIAAALLDAKQRVLILAHTHHAVDGVVEALCDRLVRQNGSLPKDGAILRLGAISRPSLAAGFGSHVSLDALLDRKLGELHAKLLAIEDDGRTLSKSIDDNRKLRALAAELRERERSVDTLQRQLEALEAEQPQQKPRASRQPPSSREHTLAALRNQLRAVTSGLERLRAKAGDISVEELDKAVEVLSRRKGSLVSKKSKLEKEEAEGRDKLIERCRVLAATATQGLLRGRDLTSFDVLILDEASMLPLPLAYYLCGLPRTRIVIAGDFRQLPPITRSRSKIASDWYERDIFEASGVVDAVDARSKAPGLVQLKTQSRSHPEICRLFNARFYGGELVSAPCVPGEQPFPETLGYLNGPRIVLLDTSPFEPYGHTEDRSKSNLLHALLVRRLVESWASLDETRRPTLGVISPYRPQANLIEELLTEERLTGVSVGTVHKFQGDERDIIIFDLTESPPHALGAFLSGTTARDKSSRLVNVSLSRAKSHLILLAHLSYFRRTLKKHHLLFGLLGDIAKLGRLVAADELLDLSEQAWMSHAGTDVSPFTPFHRYTKKNFERALAADIAQTRSSLILSTAEISPQGVQRWVKRLAALTESGASVTVAIPPVEERGADSAQGYDEAVTLLSQAGVTTIVRPGNGSGACVIDRDILWLGCSNIFSTAAGGRDAPVRASSRSACAAILRTLGVEASRNT